MSIDTEEKLGTLKISDEVIALCTMNATLKTEGISALSGGIGGSFSKNILGKDPLYKGIKVSQAEDGIIIDIHVIVTYGFKIPQVAWDVQENVKKEVELMTDADVKAVNIHVQGVHFLEEED
ncbi:Asp23/Gls24 family envelope stress response protein [Anaerovorax odorimutans]|uniref:Asp23/Gls24 family envelope stress response protein n=1 Tax=Anaerovorax odorimutans TaxID=109327 RepID=UPI0003F7F3B3|nr:Asp23/Gls24 family envelope stress response protein [Anaerovorax odorimutans]